MSCRLSCCLNGYICEHYILLSLLAEMISEYRCTMKLFLKDFTSIKVTINTKQIVLMCQILKTFSKTSLRFLGNQKLLHFKFAAT
jgi:hypothetical protein